MTNSNFNLGNFYIDKDSLNNSEGSLSYLKIKKLQILKCNFSNSIANRGAAIFIITISDAEIFIS